MDAARQQLDAEIQRTQTTAKLLTHLADAVEHGPRAGRSETYQEDAVDALVHGAEIVRDRYVNLLHVAHICDASLVDAHG